jgi:hypothetical protein
VRLAAGPGESGHHWSVGVDFVMVQLAGISTARDAVPRVFYYFYSICIGETRDESMHRAQTWAQA